MQTILNTPDDPAHDSLVEKKSEFIGDAAHVDTLDEALAFVAAIREQHPKARHVAYAAVCGGADGRLSERMSDDGRAVRYRRQADSRRTQAVGTTDCVVAVTRYFGGILLGSGGLVRAYSSAASLAMKAARAARIMTAKRYRVRLEYPQLARFQQILAQLGGSQEDESYAVNVELTAVVPQDDCARFEERVREAFNAAVVPAPIDMVNIPVPLA